MKNRFSLSLFAAAIALLGILFESPSRAAESMFDGTTLEMTIQDLYQIPSGTLTSDELSILHRALGEQIAAQSPSVFNDILFHLLADWRQNPSHRRTLEPIISASSHAAAAELLEQRARPLPFSGQLSHGQVVGLLSIEVIERTMDVFTVAYSFQFGKNLWRSRGLGLGKLEIFRNSLREASSATLRTKKGLIAAGSVAGLISASSRHLETRKMDPAESLAQTRKARVKEMGERANFILKLLKGGILGPESVTPETLYRESLSLLNEVQELLKTAPEIRHSLEPIAEDLEESLSLLGGRD